MHLAHGAMNSSAASMSAPNSNIPSSPTLARGRPPSDQSSLSNSASSTAAMTASALAQASGVLRQNSLGSMSASDVATVAAMYNQLAAYSGQHGRGMDIG